MEPSASQAPFVSATQQRWPNACPLVLTLIGDDRPDLVQSVSRVVATHGGSWQESQMARLAGKFAGILGVEIPASQSDDLEGAQAALSTDGLQVIVERSDQAETFDTTRVQIELVGSDRPDLVRELSRPRGHWYRGGDSSGDRRHRTLTGRRGVEILTGVTSDHRATDTERRRSGNRSCRDSRTCTKRL